MKPLFFPFTYLRQQDSEILLTCFKNFSFFTTSSKKEFETDFSNLSANSGIDPVFMEDDELQPVIETLNEYKKWAVLNNGNRDSLKALFRTTPYFTSDTGVANIRSEIGKRSQSGHSLEVNQIYDKDQLFLNSLLFLRLAHESDAEKQAIDLGLQSIAAGETKLFLEVKGEMGANIPYEITPDQEYDPGLLMTEKRLSAWAYVLVKKSRHFNLEEPLLLVTTSRGIADHCNSAVNDTKISANTEKLVDIENFRIHGKDCDFNMQWQADLKKMLKIAMQGGKIIENFPKEADDGCSCSADIQLYKFSGTDIKKIFFSLKMETSPETALIKDELLKIFCRNIFILCISIRN